MEDMDTSFLFYSRSYYFWTGLANRSFARVLSYFDHHNLQVHTALPVQKFCDENGHLTLNWTTAMFQMPKEKWLRICS